MASTLLSIPALLLLPGFSALSGGGPEKAWGREGPSITTDRSEGTVGSPIQVSGAGYQLCSEHCLDSEAVDLFWDGTEIGDRVPLDDTGAFSTTITVPRSTYVGTHEIVARNTHYDEQATAQFSVHVTLAMSVDPATGAPADRVRVSGTGYDTCPYYGNGSVRVIWDGYESPLATVPIRDDGTFSAEIRVPDSADYRTYQLTGQCADSGEYATTSFTVEEAASTPSPTVSPNPTPGQSGPGVVPPPRQGEEPARTGQAPPPGRATPPPSVPPGTAVPLSPSPPGGSATPSLAASAPAPAGAGWPRPELVDAIRMLGDPGLPPQAVLLLVIVLAVLAWVLIGWPAELFNRTYEKNQHVIRRWLRLERIGQFWSGLARGRPGHRWARLSEAFRGQSWPAVAFFSAVAAFAISFAEPGRVLDRENIATILGLLVAVPLVAISYEFAVESYERLGPDSGAARLRIVYPALVVALSCAVISRALDFVPGYAYGLVIAYTIVSGRREDDRRSAIAVLRASALLLTIAATTWLLRQFGTATAAAGDHTPFGLRMIDTTLGLITVMSLETLVIGLMPIRFLHGQKLWRWNRYAWLTTYVAGAAVFVLVLSGPLGDGRERLTDVDQLVRMCGLFLGFCAGSFAFWGLFAGRDWWLGRGTPGSPAGPGRARPDEPRPAALDHAP